MHGLRTGGLDFQDTIISRCYQQAGGVDSSLFLVVISSGCQYSGSCPLVLKPLNVYSLGPASVYSSCGPSTGIPLLLAAAVLELMYGWRKLRFLSC